MSAVGEPEPTRRVAVRPLLGLSNHKVPRGRLAFKGKPRPMEEIHGPRKALLPGAFWACRICQEARPPVPDLLINWPAPLSRGPAFLFERLLRRFITQSPFSGLGLLVLLSFLRIGPRKSLHRLRKTHVQPERRLALSRCHDAISVL